MTYCCGDIHGNFKALQQVLEKSKFNPEKDTLITLGDYVDGGVHMEILPLMEYLISLSSWIGIIGNHDWWMMENLKAGWEKVQDLDWLVSGGRNTLDAIGVKLIAKEEDIIFANEPPQLVYNFCDRLKYFHEDEHGNLYVHAGYLDLGRKIQDEDYQSLEAVWSTIWERSFWEFAHDFKTDHYKDIYLGHTWDFYHPKKRGQVWNLDSGAGFVGKLTLMEVRTGQIWQSDNTDDLYDNFGWR